MVNPAITAEALRQTTKEVAKEIGQAAKETFNEVGRQLGDELKEITQSGKISGRPGQILDICYHISIRIRERLKVINQGTKDNFGLLLK